MRIKFSPRHNGMIVLGAFFFMLFFMSPLYADRIVLTSGNLVEGEIVEKTPDHVTLKCRGVNLTFYNDEIQKIEETDAPDARPQILCRLQIKAKRF